MPNLAATAAVPAPAAVVAGIPAAAPGEPAALSSRSVRRRHLPGPVVATAALPRAETAAFTAVVPLLSIPVLLATMAAPAALVVALALTAAVAGLCLSRRTAVGADWVADRRLWRYRLTAAPQLRAVDHRPTGHGGVLRLHPHVGRPHRLREPEYAGAHTRSALASLVLASGGSVTPAARRVLLMAPAG